MSHTLLFCLNDHRWYQCIYATTHCSYCSRVTTLLHAANEKRISSSKTSTASHKPPLTHPHMILMPTMKWKTVAPRSVISPSTLPIVLRGPSVIMLPAFAGSWPPWPLACLRRAVLFGGAVPPPPSSRVCVGERVLGKLLLR